MEQIRKNHKETREKHERKNVKIELKAMYLNNVVYRKPETQKYAKSERVEHLRSKEKEGN